MDQYEYERLKLAVKNDQFLDVVDLLKEGAKPTMAEFVQAIQNKSFFLFSSFS